MLNLPQSTYYGKKIPKEKFYAKLDISSAMKRCFVEEIDSIVWQNKLAASTLNVSAGTNVIEIDVLEVSLKKKECTYSVFEFLDKNLPNHTVFLITFANEGQLFINYKEPLENRVGKHKITATYKTNWEPVSQIQLTVDGLNLDKVYESFVAQIAENKLAIEPHTDIKKAIIEAQDKEKLVKQIALLESKIKKEKQFNIQIKHSKELKTLKKKLL
jgi:hypothetical protein